MTLFDGIIIDSILHSLPVGILVIDHGGDISTLNRAACTLLGYHQDQLMGKGWGEIFFEDDRNNEFNQVFLDVIMHERVGLQREVPYVDPEGNQHYFSVTSSFHSQDNTVLGIIFLIHDVTELNRVKEKETQMLREKSRLQEHRIQSLNHLASSVAHQIRNPVFTIAGFANRLQKQLNERHVESAYPGIIVEEAKRLERIVKVVGRFASLIPKDLTDVRLSVLVDQAVETVGARARELDKDLTVLTDLNEIMVRVDADLFPSVFEEFLLNSLDFCPEPAIKVELSASQENGDIIISMCDNGPGLDPANQDFVFDPFYTTKSDGVGMGLTVAREIVLGHQGEIAMTNADNGGVQLVVQLRNTFDFVSAQASLT
ncbi:sensor histidine kinase [Desulfovibrio inopinatus]|uniref:sensor histidine kinase n=1 Tax=Desulfovibrio inopinatus TaxID=102109 RepID=UPI0003F9295B|nr:PAS domain S-box protein [Desulfovibrio inopinatus]